MRVHYHYSHALAKSPTLCKEPLKKDDRTTETLGRVTCPICRRIIAVEGRTFLKTKDDTPKNLTADYLLDD